MAVQQVPTQEVGAPVVRVRGAEKTFGAIRALRGVDIDLLPGEVHSLVGANGAGKSTLAKIISGALVPDAGVVIINGRESEHATLAAHRELGVAALYQETTIVPQMSAASNALLGRLRRRGPFIDRGRLRSDFEARCRELGVFVDPDVLAGTLSVATQRTLEIIRALDARHDAVLMDEPTGSLGPEEREHFYKVVRDLAAAGVSILYISHDLDEVLRISDRVSVMRDGAMVDTRPASVWIKAELVRAMLGREARRTTATAREVGSEVALSVRDLSLPGRLEGVSFDLHRGEILGLAGLVGSGRSEILRSLAGLEPTASATLVIDGRTVPPPRSVREALRLGIAMTPEDRRRDGIVPWIRAESNIVLSDLWPVSRRGIVVPRRRRDAARAVADSIGLPERMLEQPAATLSGGNQQKLVVGRWLHRLPSVLLLDEPTVGVDVGAKAEMLDFVRKVASGGTSVIVVSAEWDELIDVSDRLLVVARGRVIEALGRSEASVDRILRMVFEVLETA